MGEGRAALERVARRLSLAAAGRKAPASLFFFTDPERTPDPVSIAETLPRGAAVVYRSFGAEDAPRVASALREVARRRGLLLLIGRDEDLAVRVKADGLHLPERDVHRLKRLRARHPRWTLTAAAHWHGAAIRAAAAGADAIVLSSVFESGSLSASRAMGPVRFAQVTRRTRAPVIALGGVNSGTVRRLLGTGAAGLAAVEAWLKA